MSAVLKASAVRREQPELVKRMLHGPDEYRLYRFPSGQVKAFCCAGQRSSYEKRVAFSDLPTAEMQLSFIEATGKTAEEIGVIIME